MDSPEDKGNMRKYGSVFAIVVFVLGLFIIPGVLGVSYTPSYDGEYSYDGTTAMENMTEEVTELITQVIPIFVIIGVFGVIISMITSMMKKFGN